MRRRDISCEADRERANLSRQPEWHSQARIPRLGLSEPEGEGGGYLAQRHRPSRRWEARPFDGRFSKQPGGGTSSRTPEAHAPRNRGVGAEGRRAGLGLPGPSHQKA